MSEMEDRIKSWLLGEGVCVCGSDGGAHDAGCPAAPDDYAAGEYECPCGVLKLGAPTGTGFTSTVSVCPSCGHMVEQIVTPR